MPESSVGNDVGSTGGARASWLGCTIMRNETGGVKKCGYTGISVHDAVGRQKCSGAS